MKITIYYKNKAELNQIKEPYLGALQILEGLYFDVPGNGDPIQTYKMPDYKVMNTVLTICTQLKEESVTYASSLLACHKAVYLNTNSVSNISQEFWTITRIDCAVLFGAVYYVMAQDLAISDTNLNYISKLIKENSAQLYFQVFKEPADLLRKKMKEGQSPVDVTVDNDIQKVVIAQRQRIKSLENKVQELEKKLSVREENKSIAVEGDNCDLSCEEMTIELLLPIFYGSIENVQVFLQQIKGLSDVEITDLVHNSVKEKIISSKSYKRDLWRILHAAKLYSATESNWNTVLRNHPK